MSKTNSAALPPELDSLYRVLCEAKPHEQASYVNLEPRTKAAVDMLIERGLVEIVNAVPRPVAEVDRALSPAERAAAEDLGVDPRRVIAARVCTTKRRAGRWAR